MLHVRAPVRGFMCDMSDTFCTHTGVLTLSHRACEGEVGIHFVESWRRDHIVSVCHLHARLHSYSDKNINKIQKTSGVHAHVRAMDF